ncbi:MAG: hypothetical protein FJ138_14880, partial [Deltaproteobacteria bacterium]|nr:hypothetical protein [Deltaproteobacteria bacterium]
GRGGGGEGAAAGWARPPARAAVVLLGERREPPNPLRLPALAVGGPPAPAVAAWAAALEGGGGGGAGAAGAGAWLGAWRALDARHAPPPPAPAAPLTGELIAHALGDVARALPARLHVHIASSSPFRDLDLALRPAPHTAVWSQRGANGIDGTLSAALGAARALPPGEPLVAWLGDLAAFHDLQGLAAWGLAARAGRLARPCALVLANNGGGGIFAQLPVRDSEAFEEAFLTPVPLDWAPLCAALGVPYRRAERLDALAALLGGALRAPGVTLLEVPLPPPSRAGALL